MPHVRARVRFLLFSLALLFIAQFRAQEPDQPTEPIAIAAPEPELIMTRATLGKGETLGSLFRSAGVPDSVTHLLVGVAGEHLDVRRLRPGVSLEVATSHTGRVRYARIEVDADRMLTLYRTPSGFSGEMQLVKVRTDTLVLAGSIDEGGSLYAAIVRIENLPEADRKALVASLASIYGYQIDFLHDIRPGDHYRLLLERDVRPDGTAREQRIIAAEVTADGKPYRAIRFEQDSGIDYFDENGASIRFAFRRYPLEFVRITSAFSWRRYHPTLGIYRAHYGTDFGAPTGTPVYATADGEVVFAGRRGGYGNLVEIRHAQGYSTRYAHLSRFSINARRGTRIRQGDVIGYVGATGVASGPHLHYELRRNGDPTDARTVNLPTAEPVPADQREEFMARASALIGWLDEAAAQGTVGHDS